MSCPSVKVDCICGSAILRSELAVHKTNHCRLRMVPCVHCQQTQRFEEMTAHYPVCPKLFVDCLYRSQGCRVQLLRQTMREHHAICEFATLCCPVPQCGHRFLRRDKLDHFKQADLAHHGRCVSAEVNRFRTFLVERGLESAYRTFARDRTPAALATLYLRTQDARSFTLPYSAAQSDGKFKLQIEAMVGSSFRLMWNSTTLKNDRPLSEQGVPCENHDNPVIVLVDGGASAPSVDIKTDTVVKLQAFCEYLHWDVPVCFSSSFQVFMCACFAGRSSRS